MTWLDGPADELEDSDTAECCLCGRQLGMLHSKTENGDPLCSVCEASMPEPDFDLPYHPEKPHAPTEPRECSICRGRHGLEIEHPTE